MMKAVIASAAALGLVACGEFVEIPPAHVGVILDSNGYKPNVLPPSRFRLPWDMVQPPRLINIEASDRTYEEAFQLLMPRDNLNLTFDLRVTSSIRSSDEAIKRILDRVSPGSDRLITADEVYETYGRPVVRSIVRNVVAEYTIDEVASSRVEVNRKIYEALQEAFKRQVLSISLAELADVQFPEVITTAREAAARREVDIQTAEADKQVQLVELQTELERAQMQRRIRRERAEAAAEENAIFAASVTSEYLQYKTLEVLEALAENGASTFIPLGALDAVGANVRMFNNGN